MLRIKYESKLGANCLEIVRRIEGFLIGYHTKMSVRLHGLRIMSVQNEMPLEN